MHHIVPKASGGADEFENAIPLCFDCHAWAGHYFAGHPRGTAFSPSELRKARDDWYSKFERGEVTASEDKALLAVKYFLCRDWDIGKELLQGNLKLAPVKSALLAQSPVVATVKKLISSHSEYRSTNLAGDAYSTIEEYKAAYPSAQVSTTYPYASGSERGYAFYGCVRNCEEKEVRERVLSRDPISAFLATRGASLSELCVAVADNGDCGDGSLAESYRLRPLWPVFVAFKNVSNEPIALDFAAGLVDDGEDFRALSNNTAKPGDWKLPAAEIEPNQTVLVLVAILVAPLSELGESLSEGEAIIDQGEYSQVTYAASFPEEGLENFRVVGPRMRPKSISMRVGSSQVIQDIHDFDLENVYTIDRDWQCGSCPHLFYSDMKGGVRYVREIISGGFGRQTTDSFSVPEGVSAVMIAELEDEVTYFDSIVRDGVLVGENVTLRRGSLLQYRVNGGERFEFLGSYFFDKSAAPRIEASAMRNRIICQFLMNQESRLRVS